MLASFFIPSGKQFKLRWLFGLGVFLFLFSIGIFTTLLRQNYSEFNFPDINKTYSGVVTDIPQIKPNTIAYKVNLADTDKNIICYIPKNKQQHLKAGDSFIFFSHIQPFKSVPNRDGFNYATYMYNKGYAGYTFIHPDRWEKIEKKTYSPYILAVQCRQYILDIYKTLNLNPDELAMLSALTLGYKDTLSDDLVQSFRATGTAHILAVSGMHVGIIYFVILSVFSFIPGYSRYIRLKFVFVIIFLWLYAFIIGFPPSAVRACIMLTFICIAQILRMRAYTLNTLFSAAFTMLIWNPMQIFDPGFQLSFMAVLSMVVLLPVFSRFVSSRNKYIRYIINILFVSLAAQIGTLPLSLYYFGTFPTYFIITNLLVIPLISLIFYSAFAIGIMVFLGSLIPSLYTYMVLLPVFVYKKLVAAMTQVIYFFEHLPFSQITDIHISFISIFLIWVFVFSLVRFFISKNSRALIVSFGCIFLLNSSLLYSKVENRNTLNIYNNFSHADITYFIGFKEFHISEITGNKLLRLNNIDYFIIKEDLWKGNITQDKFNIDYLHIVGDEPVSLYSLNQKFMIKKVILDGSLSVKSLKRLIRECEKLRIPYYDVSCNGVLRIFF